MEEKILAMLKTKATAFGFSETELSEAAKTIASFINNAEATDEEITSKVDLMLPVLGLSQKAANRVIEKAKKSAEEEAKKQQKANAGAENKNNPSKTDEENNKTKTDDMPAWFKTYMENQDKKTQELEKKLTEMSAEKTLTERKSKLEELLKDSGVFGKTTMKSFEKMNFGSNEEYDTYFNDVKADLESWKKERTDAGLDKITPMGRSNAAPEKKLTDEEVKGIAANL